jgi:hypothetical protein
LSLENQAQELICVVAFLPETVGRLGSYLVNSLFEYIDMSHAGAEKEAAAFRRQQGRNYLLGRFRRKTKNKTGMQ